MKHDKIIAASELPLEEKIYLKKDFLGWRIVHPMKDEDGSINWGNLIFGGWRNFFTLIIILMFVLGFFYVYYHDTTEMQKVVENPCEYCQQINLIFPSGNSEDLHPILNAASIINATG
jgi:hypothetical protein